MRTLAVAAFMLFIIVYAQRNWYRALCALIVFTALTEYPGLPNPVQARGFNHWSIMLAAITVGWGVDRLAHPRPWNIPRGWLITFGLYLFLEIIAIARLCGDLDVFTARAALVHPGYAYYDFRAVIIDCFYGPARYLFFAFLLLDGVRTRRDLLIGMAALVAAVVVYSLVVNKEIPLSALSGDGAKYRMRVSKWTGRHPNDLAQDCATFFWIIVTFLQARLGAKWLRLAVFPSALAVLLCLVHTHSRGGYLALAGAGIAVLIVGKSWRTFAVMAIIAILVFAYAPSVTDRLLTGFDTSGLGQHDVEGISAGRQIIWPAALEGISEAPLTGYGRYGYVMSSALDISRAQGGGEMHPHNAFLEAALDHGILGAMVLTSPLIYILITSVSLARKRKDPLLCWVGLAGVSATVAAIISGISGQHFVLYENLWVYWCMTSLVTKASVLADRLPQPERTPPLHGGTRTAYIP